MMRLFKLTQQDWEKFLQHQSTQIAVVSMEKSKHPFKHILFPPHETLFYFRKDTHKELSEIKENKVLYYGLPPCDAKTIQLLGLNLLADPADPYFQTIRDNTVIISKACDHFEPNCFCDQIGGSPGALNGASAILYTVEDGFHLLVNHDWLSEQLVQMNFIPSEVENEKADFSKGSVPVREINPLPIDHLREKGLSTVSKTALWEKVSATCLACGICTFLCPACYCFDIQDISFGRVGKRERTYDSCLFSIYTTEASGHNPRPTIKERWRQRLLHKFTYYPMQYGEIGCTGCGRCISECSSHIDIREVIRNAAQYCE